MCIGIPMQVLDRAAAGAAAVAVQGPDGPETVDVRLVGAVQPGQWLLVFQGAARELLDPERAAEIRAALALLGHGLAGHHDPGADPGFSLPSSMSAAELAALTGSR